MNIGNRSARALVRAPLQAGHYRALLGMALRYPDPMDSARRYLTGQGEYPHRVRVRTPVGTISPLLHSSHDMSTVNEVFCREDYRVGRDVRVAVDVGSNIGISALYFLTRNHLGRVYLFEPDPKNVRRMRANLHGYEDRVEIAQLAVGVEAGQASFRVESTGRYGSLLGAGRDDPAARDLITVEVQRIDSLLEGILSTEGHIDVLKIDTEGTERALVQALKPRRLDHISSIYYETDEPTPLHTCRFDFHYSCQTNRLLARADGRTCQLATWRHAPEPANGGR